MTGAVEREVYTVRAAEIAKIAPDAMKLEVRRAMKRKNAKEKKAELRRDLNPSTSLQPKERSLRYENIRSARAEEGLLRLILLDESLFDTQAPPAQEEFSSPLLGRAFSLLHQAHREGRTVGLHILASELSGEEMSHITCISQQPESLRNGAKALSDYISIIQSEANKRAGGDMDPLLAATEKYKNKKGTGGKHS